MWDEASRTAQCLHKGSTAGDLSGFWNVLRAASPRYNGVPCLMVANRDVTCRMTVHVVSLTSESLVKVFLSLFALIKDSLVAIRPANMAVRAKVDPELCQQWQIMRRTKKNPNAAHLQSTHASIQDKGRNAPFKCRLHHPTFTFN